MCAVKVRNAKLRNYLKWKSLECRRAEHQAIFAYKAINNMLSHQFSFQLNCDFYRYIQYTVTPDAKIPSGKPRVRGGGVTATGQQ
jgi:hypothetical protein